MRQFASATVSDVESHFNLPRTDWDVDVSLPSDEIVTFFLEDPTSENPPSDYLYHAFVDVGDQPVLYGSVSEIPATWLSADQIMLYFKTDVKTFANTGFLDRYFGEDE